MMIKRSILKEYVTAVNIHTANIVAPQYIRQMRTAVKGEINTIIVGDFNTPLLSMDRSSKQKINKETKALIVTLDQMDLTDFYRAFYWKTTEYTIFPSAYGTFSRINHVLGHKASLGKFKQIKTVSGIFSDHVLWD